MSSTVPLKPPGSLVDERPGVPPAVSPGGGEILNVHSRVVPFTPGQTSWTASGVVAITVRTDKAAPKVGEVVHF